MYIWRDEKYVFLALTWVNRKTKEIVLEVKRWEKDSYNLDDFGSHDTLYWDKINGNAEREIFDIILSVISQFKTSEVICESTSYE